MQYLNKHLPTSKTFGCIECLSILGVCMCLWQAQHLSSVSSEQIPSAHLSMFHWMGKISAR